MPTKKKEERFILPPSGGPPKNIDWKIVEALCRAQATLTQIAQIAGCAESTLRDAVEREFKCKWGDYYDYHRQSGLGSLRMAQFQTAMEGNVTMQIWLGKQVLDQKDRQDVGFDPDRPAHFVMNMGKKLEKENPE